MKDARLNDPAPAATALDAEALLREQRLQRNLKLVIGFMSFLILAGLSAIVIRIMVMASRPPQPTPAATVVTAAPIGDVALAIPQGAKIISVSASNGRLVVYHESPAGAGITVLDLETGKRLYDVKPVEAAIEP